MVICGTSIIIILICRKLGFVGPAQQKKKCCLCLTVIDVIFWDFLILYQILFLPKVYY